METLCLTSKEILYIASIGEADEFIGIPDGFYGMDEAEIATEISKIRSSLMDKSCAEMDFDGNFTIKNEIVKLINECANFNRYIAFEKVSQEKSKTIRFYFGENSVYFVKNEEDNFTIDIISKSAIKKELLGFIEWKSNNELSNDTVILETALLNKVKSMNEFDNPENELKMMGCDNLKAKIICSGLNGSSEYYSLVNIDHTKENNQFHSLMFINAEEGAVELLPVESETESVEAVSVKLTAITNKIEEIIGDLEQEPEGVFK